MTDKQRKKYMKEYRAAHREKLAAYARAWWKKMGKIQNAKRRHKYKTNTAFRSAELERHRREREAKRKGGTKHGRS